MFEKIGTIAIIIGIAYLRDYRVLKDTGRRQDRIVYLVLFAVSLSALLYALFNERGPSPITWLNKIHVGWMSHE